MRCSRDKSFRRKITREKKKKIEISDRREERLRKKENYSDEDNKKLRRSYFEYTHPIFFRKGFINNYLIKKFEPTISWF